MVGQEGMIIVLIIITTIVIIITKLAIEIESFDDTSLLCHWAHAFHAGKFYSRILQHFLSANVRILCVVILQHLKC